MGGIEAWWRAGELVRLSLGGVEREVFLRRAGAGPPLTLLHGFPSSSHDWAKIAPELAARHALLMPDLLGFGASEKPADHRYSLSEQADLVERVWSLAGIDSTAIVAHDYSVSVAQELLARRAEGALDVEIERLHLLNGGLYPELHRQQPTQTALLDPDTGPQLCAALNEEVFLAALAPTFAPGYDFAADGAAIWAATSRADGQRIAHLLIGYIPDRDENRDRWVGALEATDVPLAFVWGMLDPISGAHMAEHIRSRLPGAPFLALEDVGHWPPLEAPERVVESVLSGR